MERVCTSSAVAARPAATDDGGTPGFFTKGDPTDSPPIPATKPGPEWFNRVQEEISAVIEGAGLVLDPADDTQLRQSIAAMIAGAVSSKAVKISPAAFAVGVVDKDVVRWDAAAGNFAKAVADGTANNQAVGFADVTNALVYAFGETRAGLFAGLTPGARYYLDAVTPGAITTVAPADLVKLGIAKSADVMFVDIDAQTQTSIGKQSLPVRAQALTPSKTNGCAALAVLETAVHLRNFAYLAFDSLAEERAWVAVPMPKSSDETVGISIRNLKWAHAAGAVAFGVAWGVKALALGDGDALDAAAGAEVVIADVGGAAETIYAAPESAAITPAGPWAEGDTLYIEIARKVANAGDTLSVDAWLGDFELVFTTNAGVDA